MENRKRFKKIGWICYIKIIEGMKDGFSEGHANESLKNVISR